MRYEELEQFYGRGEEKAFWLLSFKNIAGLFIGGFIGHRLGTLLGGAGASAMVIALLCACIGIGLTVQVKGILALKRLLILLRFAIRRAVKPILIDAQVVFEIVTETEQPVRVRKQGAGIVLAPRRTTVEDGGS